MPNFLVILHFTEYGNYKYMSFESNETCCKACNDLADHIEINKYIDEMNVYKHDANTGNYVLIRRYI